MWCWALVDGKSFSPGIVVGAEEVQENASSGVTAGQGRLPFALCRAFLPLFYSL